MIRVSSDSNKSERDSKDVPEVPLSDTQASPLLYLPQQAGPHCFSRQELQESQRKCSVAMSGD